MSVQIHADSIVSWSSSAVATDVNDEVVLMNMERNRCYGLGATGSQIWRLLSSPIRVSDLVSKLQGEYDAPEGQIEVDVVSTLADLHSEGLVQIHTQQ
jgi:hypothetical protein